MSQPLRISLEPKILHEMDKARGLLIAMMEKRSGERADEDKRQRKAIFSRLDSIKPQDWNNIPIPVQDGFITLLAFSRNAYEQI